MSRLLRVLWTLLLPAFLLAAGIAQAHEVRPAYLELKEVAPGTYDLLWKVPAKGEDLRFGLHLRLPENCQRGEPATQIFSAGAHFERSRIACTGGLAGGEILVEGLSATMTDTLVRIEWAGGGTQVTRLTPDAPSFRVEVAPTGLAVARTYLGLGVEHILLGVDHLLFVLALLIVVKGRGQLVATVTAFTVAHSITLALATLGFVHVPPAPVEAVIALSIVFVAAEIVRMHGATPHRSPLSQRGARGDFVGATQSQIPLDPPFSKGEDGPIRGGSLTARAPWIVAFTFGLLHGFGFAGALSEIGLPQGHIPLALLFFNVGVELGQLLFIAAVLGAIALIGRLRVRLPRWAGLVPPYAIGSVAVFWVIQRIAAS